jgi:cellulose biosynthesis protein BcsQ
MVGEQLVDQPNCWFLPNSDSVRDHSSETSGSEDDSLEESEMRLMINWIFERDPSDIRFLLRKALHDIQLEDCFDFILMDCPPRLTTACINGLAASDYVLVPVTLDAMATNSVPYLLKSLDYLKKDILPNLQILGIVANQVTKRDGFPVGPQRDAWDSLKFQCNRREPNVCFFETMIQDNSAIGRFATQAIEEDNRALRQTKTYEKPRENFEELALEVEKEIASHHGQVRAPVLAL